MGATDDAENPVPEPDPESGPNRLAIYGSLAPGQPNHHQLDGLAGDWLQGYVHGSLIHAGWGATMGYPAIALDPSGPEVPVQVFESSDLSAHWARLDAFEGVGYERVVTTVHTPAGDLAAYIYALVRER